MEGEGGQGKSNGRDGCGNEEREKACESGQAQDDITRRSNIPGNIILGLTTFTRLLSFFITTTIPPVAPPSPSIALHRPPCKFISLLAYHSQ